MESIIPFFFKAYGADWQQNRILDLLFPRPCVHCGQSRKKGSPCLCVPCREELRGIDSPVCHHCGLPAPLDYDYPTDDFLCSACRRSPPAFDRARSLGTYESVFRSVIAFYKYQNQPGALAEFQQALKDFFSGSEVFPDVEGLIPVPLHRTRLKERGFDQGYCLGEVIAELMSVPILGNVVERVRETPTQTRLTRAERLRNLKGAFEVFNAAGIAGRTLLVVDDVMTTGATLHEMARNLKKAGARTVYAFTLARTP